MDSKNLATLFGPNLLHKAKGGEFEVESLERLDERGDVIAVVKTFIDHYREIFELPVETYDEVLKALQETNPDALDALLRRKLQSAGSSSSGVENEVETGSSHCDDTDSSAATPVSNAAVAAKHADTKNTTSYDSTILRQKQFHNVQVHDTMRSNNGVKLRDRLHSVVESPTQVKDTAQQMNYRRSTPDPTWQHAAASVTPSRKHPPTSLQVRITADTYTHTGPPSRIKKQLHGKGKEAKENSQSGNFLTVPSYRNSKERASNSSLSSGYYGSSRSGTTSPTTPDVPNKWYMDTPPGSPPPTRTRPKLTADFSSNATPTPFQRTSSLQRPLGFAPIINISNSSSPAKYHCSKQYNDPERFKSASLPQWQVERWRHWEQVARKRGDERQEQETLV